MWSLGILLSFVVCSIVLFVFGKNWKRSSPRSDEIEKSSETKKPISVNYHLTRVCNYSCGFCFHTQKSSFKLSVGKAKEGIKLLKEAGMKKINFAGGEPFLEPRMLGELCKYAKEDLQLESVSIVSNGSKIRELWMKQYGQYVDIMCISVDSFDEETNIKIGRGNGKHLKNLCQIAEMCKLHNIKFKLNTVVNSFNWEEDMNEHIAKLNPFRWKVFQVLIIEEENCGNDTLRDARKFVITDEQFQAFLKRHSSQKCMVSEDNTTMRSSYLILDEEMRFLDCSGKKKEPSPSILKVGVAEALQQSGFDDNMFSKRGGIYEWTKNPPCGSDNKNLDW